MTCRGEFVVINAACQLANDGVLFDAGYGPLIVSRGISEIREFIISLTRWRQETCAVVVCTCVLCVPRFPCFTSMLISYNATATDANFSCSNSSICNRYHHEYFPPQYRPLNALHLRPWSASFIQCRSRCRKLYTQHILQSGT